MTMPPADIREINSESCSAGAQDGQGLAGRRTTASRREAEGAASDLLWQQSTEARATRNPQSNRLAASMRGVDGEDPSVRSDDLKRVVNATSSDRSWGQSPLCKDAVRSVNVVEHQVEGRSRARLGWLVALYDSQMRAAAQFKYRQIAV